MPIYRYQIDPRPESLGGGWKLKLYEDEVEVGGGVFPTGDDDDLAGMAWFNELSEAERLYWLNASGSAVAAEARGAFLRDEAFQDAQKEAEDWVNSRDE